LKEVGRALKAPLSSLGILSGYAARKIRGYVAPGGLTRAAPELADEAGLVSKYTRAAAGILETLLLKHGKDVIGKQYHQERLANVAIDLYASVAVLSRATAAAEKRGGEKAAEEIRLAKAFVNGAKYRIVGQLKETDRNVGDPKQGRDAWRTEIAQSAYARMAYGSSYWE